MHDPFLIIISSPSGAGKSTICNMITKNDQKIKLSISTTTRPKRPNEIDGHHYYFRSALDFSDSIKRDEFLEHAKVFGYEYGTPKVMVESEMKSGNDVLFDIDWQGARQIKDKFKANEVLSIFLLPPSLEELESRLRKRASDSESTLQNRMEKAKDEISHFDEYEHILINEKLDDTYQKISAIIEAKRSSRANKNHMLNFVNTRLICS